MKPYLADLNEVVQKFNITKKPENLEQMLREAKDKLNVLTEK